VGGGGGGEGCPVGALWKKVNLCRKSTIGILPGGSGKSGKAYEQEHLVLEVGYRLYRLGIST